MVKLATTIVLSSLFMFMITAATLPDETKVPAHLRRVAADWKTNWLNASIDLKELMSGGPPRDGIPPIDDPTFVTTVEAGRWLSPAEPVMAVVINGEARAYPLQILIFHEIVNDTVGETPVAITFCPLCNSAMVFDRRFDGLTLTFGTSGLLRKSDLVMWDRQTESLWQQVTGKAMVGELNGARLAYLPSSLVSFAEFKSAHPSGSVLSRETGHQRPYGRNPYSGYDEPERKPFLYRGPTDRRLPPMARVITFSIDDRYYGIPHAAVKKGGVMHTTIDGQQLVAFHSTGTASAFDKSSISDSRDVGSTGLFRASANGRELNFERRGNSFRDRETGSTWNIFGTAIDGALKGTQLEQISSGDHFWFAWYAFRPYTKLIE